MSQSKRAKPMTPPQEFALLKEHLCWRLEQIADRRTAPLITMKEFAAKCGRRDGDLAVSESLLSKAARNRTAPAFSQRWADVLVGFGITIEAALQDAREWLTTPVALPWLRGRDAWPTIFPNDAEIANRDPPDVTAALAIAKLKGLGRPLLDVLRAELIERERRHEPLRFLIEVAISAAENPSILTILRPQLGPIPTVNDAPAVARVKSKKVTRESK